MSHFEPTFHTSFSLLFAFRATSFVRFSKANAAYSHRGLASAISSELLVKLIDYKVTRQAASYYNKYYKLSRYLRINSLIICFHILLRSCSGGSLIGGRDNKQRRNFNTRLHACNCKLCLGALSTPKSLLILYLN